MDAGFLQETKSILKSLVLSCPNGMTIGRLNTDYKEVVGNWIPYQKLGYTNLELFLKSVPDTLVVTGHGREARIGFVSNEKLQHINYMVSQQKNTTRERKVAVLHIPSQKSRDVNLHQTHVKKFETTPAPISCTFNRGNPVNNKLNTNTSLAITSEKYAWQPKQTYINRNHVVRENAEKSVPTVNINYKPGPEYFKKSITNRTFNEPDNKNLIDKQKNPKILGNQNNLKSECDPPKSVKNTVERDNSLRMCEPHSSRSILIDRYSTNKTYQDNIRNIARRNHSRNVFQQPTKSESILNLDNDLNNLKIENRLDEQNCAKPVSDQQNLLKEIRFPYRKQSAGRISQPLELITDSETKNESCKSSFGDKIITDPFCQINTTDDLDEAVPEFAANNLVFRVDFPENVVAFGTRIPDFELPQNLTKGTVVGVFISEIHSPFKFWFHIHKENHELDILMDRIECFYRRLYNNDLIIPESCLTRGQVCAALYNDMWHRAEILNNACNNKVKVHFVDYGTVSEIEIDHIKYLPTIFANTPIQAVRGSLSHIRPVSTLWPKRAIREFLSMVSEVLLYAQIMEIDEKDKTVYMVLCDTNKGKPVQINKQLVDRGFAKLDSNWDENKITKNGYRKRHPREIFPTFEMLETGEYPSLFELEQLLAQGIDYEKITEKIILSNLNTSVCDDLVLREDTHTNTMSFNLLDTNPFKCDIISEIVSLKIFGD